MGLDDTGEFSLDDVFPRWFWAAGVVLVVGIGALLVLWYIEHPDRSPWEDFARRPFEVPDDLSGLVGTAPEDGPGDPTR